MVIKCPMCSKPAKPTRKDWVETVGVTPVRWTETWTVCDGCNESFFTPEQSRVNTRNYHRAVVRALRAVR